MSLSLYAEVIWRRRFTFALAFVLLAGAGVSILAPPRPIFRYTARVDVAIDREQAIASDGPLALFVDGSEQSRRKVVRSREVMELAAAALKEKPDLFAEFDLQGEISPERWERFLSQLRFSVNLISPTAERASLSVSAATEKGASQIVQAVAAALLQWLRGSPGPLSTHEFEALAQDTQAAKKARIAWQAFTQHNNLVQAQKTLRQTRRRLDTIGKTLARLTRQQQQARDRVRAEVKNLHLGRVSASQTAALIHLLSKSLRDMEEQIARLAEDKATLAETRKTLEPVIQQGVRLQAADQQANRRLAHSRKAAGTTLVDGSVDAAQILSLSSPLVVRGDKPVGVDYGPARIVGVLVVALLLASGMAIGRESLASHPVPAPRASAAVLDYEVLSRIPPASAASSTLEIVAEEQITDAVERLHERIVRKRQDLRALWVTSARRWEGKTTVAVALARHFAASGRDVLLIDANIHNPGLQQVFNFDNRYGLTTLLEGHAQAAEKVQKIKTGKSKSIVLADLLVNTSIDNLRVLPGGPPPLDPEYWPLAGELKTVAREAAALAEVVIYDCRTLSRRSEVEKLISVLDSVLVVIAPGESKELDIVSTNYVFSEIRRNIIGAVLNLDEKEAQRLRPGKPQVATA